MTLSVFPICLYEFSMVIKDTMVRLSNFKSKLCKRIKSEGRFTAALPREGYLETLLEKKIANGIETTQRTTDAI
jgi:hypothetical protein